MRHDRKRSRALHPSDNTIFRPFTNLRKMIFHKFIMLSLLKYRRITKVTKRLTPRRYPRYAAPKQTTGRCPHRRTFRFPLVHSQVPLFTNPPSSARYAEIVYRSECLNNGEAKATPTLLNVWNLLAGNTVSLLAIRTNAIVDICHGSTWYCEPLI